MKTKSTFLKKLGAAALAAAVVVGALAVSAQPAAAASKLKVSEKKYEKTYTLDDGTAYYELSFKYPVVAGDSEAANKINQEINRQRKVWIKQAKADEADYKTAYKDYLDALGSGKPAWSNSDEVAYEVTANDGKFFSVLMSGYLYTGGAHGMPYRIAMTFDAQTGEKLTAAKILGTTKAKVNAKVRNLYLKKYDKKGAAAGFYGEGTEGRTALEETLKPMNFNQAFYVKNAKLVFYAAPYVLGPYAAGFMEVSASIK